MRQSLDEDRPQDAGQEQGLDHGLILSRVLGLQRGLQGRSRRQRKREDKIPGMKLKKRGDVSVKPSKKTLALRLLRKQRHVNGKSTNSEGNIGIETPVVEHQALNHVASAFFLMIADCCIKATMGESWPLLEGMFQILQPTTSREPSSIVASSAMAVDSLENLVLRLGQIEKNLIGFNFIYMLDTIQLRGKVVR